ncbi:uncharacterized protein BXZ73DRAFT_76042 [Epithele typhae]|uniref:uncharacterized protein n=1 Tax=Epithele typhae TaxID=378194 RepID=UPI0020087523|nr:uncharacterized protein BXZ73DRAFT_76042 [Epithele typhae]KAH9939331.1 hypothetical protein BXZ73DRAFT_76042 [Epithele typhae]
MFEFVPRKVALKSQKAASRPQASSYAGPSTLPQALDIHTDSLDVKGKGKSAGSAKDDDFAVLLCLSLSDHSLWSNVDLRMAVTNADDGWIPLSYLIGHSAHFLHLSTRPPEAALARAARTHAVDLLEVRMLVSKPEKAAWYGKDASWKEDTGGFEVRRKDWDDALKRARNSNRSEWEACTVYIEGIPLSHRSVSSIYRFASHLVVSDVNMSTRVQQITLPPHHLDRPGDAPKCKGFALVTLAGADDASRLATTWPWHPRRTVPPDDLAQSLLTLDAVKFGFRCLAKARWEMLKEEYVTYRQQLLNEMTPAGRGSTPNPSLVVYTEDERSDGGANGRRPADGWDSAPTTNGSTFGPSSPFPLGCVVFVRNVHPETNKTALKALFSLRAFKDSPSALDYIDYNKGMLSCHLRLASPQYARTLVDVISARPPLQSTGLDAIGTGAPNGSQKPIEVELVAGERESLYWERVPEKVRRDAVRRAIMHLEGGDAGADDGDEDSNRDEGTKRARKRRRRA